jgi:hypothetical protein
MACQRLAQCMLWLLFCAMAFATAAAFLLFSLEISIVGTIL